MRQLELSFPSDPSAPSSELVLDAFEDFDLISCCGCGLTSILVSRAEFQDCPRCGTVLMETVARL